MMCLFLLAGIFFSYNYISTHTTHDCSGEECAICIQIEEAVCFLSKINYSSHSSFVFVVLCLFAGNHVSVTQSVILKKTLVNLKVELLN